MTKPINSLSSWRVLAGCGITGVARPAGVSCRDWLTTSPGEPPNWSGSASWRAAQVRDPWGVPRGPVRDVVRLLERNGILVIRFRVSIEKVDAFCVDFPDRPVVALGQTRGSATARASTRPTN
jgi:hypothetical protein